MIKEGLHSDGAQRAELLAIARWKSTGKGEELISLADYVAAMPAEQQHIYFIAGADEAALRTSPHLEVVRARGWDVLLMTDPVDEWVLQTLNEFEGHEFRSVTKGNLDKPASDDDSEAPPLRSTRCWRERATSWGDASRT